jgi:hypothetical protein
VPCSASRVVPGAHRVVGPGTHRGSEPREVHTTRVKPQLHIAQSPESLHGLQRNFGNSWGTSWATSTSRESTRIAHNQKGIEDFNSLGQELEQHEKPPNRVRFKRDLGGKVTSQRGTRSSYMTPNKIPKKSSSKLGQKNHNMELRKSPQRRTGKAPHNLEEPRRTIYTYHEGSYKV